jgi:hypothetical protein
MANESRYNDAYFCVVERSTISGNSVAVHFTVTGDNSLGALQGAEDSTLYVNEQGVKPTSAQVSGDDLQKSGCLTYTVENAGALPQGALQFEYGWSGYSACTLTPLLT